MVTSLNTNNSTNKLRCQVPNKTSDNQAENLAGKEARQGKSSQSEFEAARFSLERFNQEYPLRSEGGLAVPGLTEVIDDNSPTLLSGYSSFVSEKAGSRSLEPRVGLGEDSFQTKSVTLETVAKRSTASERKDYVKSEQLPWIERTCDQKEIGWFISAECEDGHRFAKELVCGKEWCSICGEDKSVAHDRRFARWLPKAMQIKSMGYFVFTLPLEVRGRYRTKESLSELRHQIIELLKRFGYKRTLNRWHWFGDIAKNGLRGDIPFHPHFNVIVDGVFMPPTKRKALSREYSKLVGVKVAPENPHYEYTNKPGKMVHHLRYIARATFRNCDWDKEMALELRGFRNQCWSGSGLWANLEKNPEAAMWSLSDLEGEAKEAVEGLNVEAITALEEKICPVCGEPLKVDHYHYNKREKKWEEVIWSLPMPIGLLDIVEKVPYGAGYYRVFPDSPPHGSIVDRTTGEITEVYNDYHSKYSGLNLSKTLGGSYLPTGIAKQRWEQFMAQQRAHIEDWLNRKHLDDIMVEEEDYAT